MVAYRFSPEENPAPSARPRVCSGFTIYMLAARTDLEDVTFCVYGGNVLFDSSGQKIHAVNCVVISCSYSETFFIRGAFWRRSWRWCTLCDAVRTGIGCT